jgi:hypothetical protein
MLGPTLATPAYSSRHGNTQIIIMNANNTNILRRWLDIVAGNGVEENGRTGILLRPF